MSAFQKYWKNLKESNPKAYEERLRVNRERIKKMRKAIYDDPEKHAAHKKRQREKYKRKVEAAKLTQQPMRQISQSGQPDPSAELRSG